MRRTSTILAVITAVGVAGCMDRGRQPETTPPDTTATTGDMPMDDVQAMEDRAQMQREQYREPAPQYGQREEPSREPPTYGEMQRQPGEMEPQYGATQPPMGGALPQGEDAETIRVSAQVEEALRGAPDLEDDTIVVRVQGSRVKLAGIVDSPTEVNIARDVVSSIPGVDEVDVDELRVVTRR